MVRLLYFWFFLELCPFCKLPIVFEDCCCWGSGTDEEAVKVGCCDSVFDFVWREGGGGNGITVGWRAGDSDLILWIGLGFVVCGCLKSDISGTDDLFTGGCLDWGGWDTGAGDSDLYFVLRFKGCLKSESKLM